MKIEYSSDPFEDRPEASVTRYEETRPVPFEASDIGANEDHLVWQFESPPNSRWFDQGALLKLEPGEYTDFQSHRPDVEGNYEVSSRIFHGEVTLRTEYGDEDLEQFDAVVVPAGAAYQFGNTGGETAWIGTWASVGQGDLQEASTRPPYERPGAAEEYARINAARVANGLEPDGDTDYDGDPDEGRSRPQIRRFSETKPAPISLSPEAGNNAARADWFQEFDEADFFSHNTVVKMEPGEFLTFHSHFEGEGPYEELYWIIDGKFRLQTEYWDTTLEQFDHVFCPTGCAHSVGNVGTETAWFAAFSTQGGVERDAAAQGVFDEVEPGERPTVVEEYKRIMAARKKRGLSIPSNVTVELSGDAAE